jgi:hypothetical protein
MHERRLGSSRVFAAEGAAVDAEKLPGNDRRTANAARCT